MSHERECDICGRGTDAFVCWDCAKRFQRDMSGVAALVEDLEIAITRRATFTGEAARVHGQPESAVPFHEGASEAMNVLRNVLGSWIRIVSESESIELPKGA